MTGDDIRAPLLRLQEDLVAIATDRICGFTDPDDESFQKWAPILIGDGTPIERILHYALRLTGLFAGVPVAVSIETRLPAAPPRYGPFSAVYVERERQIVELEWRVDWLVSVFDREGQIRCLIVEADGHDFHERTKEQAKRDRSRDRRASELGYTVYRFTGSEIWNDPCRCAQQILNWAATTGGWVK